MLRVNRLKLIAKKILQLSEMMKHSNSSRNITSPGTIRKTSVREVFINLNFDT